MRRRQRKVGQRAAGFGTLVARSGLSFNQNEIAGILGEAFGAAPGSTPVDPASRVDTHFRQLHGFVFGTKEKPAPMEAAIDKMGTIYQGMIQVSNAPNQGQALLGLAGGGAAVAAAPRRRPAS